MELFAPLALVGWWLAVHALVRREPELLWFAVVAAVVALLYPAALAGALLPAARALFWAGLLLLIPGIYIHLMRRPELGRRLLAPGPMLLLAGTVLFWLRFHGFTYYMWDEFSNWGLMTKEMVATNALLGPHTLVGVSDYPPGAALLQYFFAANTAYSEGVTYLAQFVLLTAPLGLLFRGITWRRWWWVGLLAGAVLYFLHLLGQGLVSLYVDTVLAVFFAMAVWAWFCLDRDRGLRLFLLPVLAALPLLKPTAVFFALAAAALFALDDLAGAWWRRRREPGAAAGRRAWLPGTALVLALALLPLLVWASWGAYTRSHGLAKISAEAEQVGPAQVLAALSPSPKGLAAKVRAGFWQRLFVVPNGNVRARHRLLNLLAARWGGGGDPQAWRLILPAWWLLSGLMFLGAAWLGPGGGPRLRVAAMWGGLSLLLAAYLLLLLLCYIFLFSSLEAEGLYSFSRYANSFLLAMCLLGLALMGNSAAGREAPAAGGRGARIAFWALALALALLMVGETPTVGLGPYLQRAKYAPVRQPLRPLVEMVEAKVPKDQAVYIILQDNKGFEHRVLAFDLAPRRVNSWNWSLGKPYYDGDAWTTDWSPRRWAAELKDKGYGWVLLAKADDAFWSRYGVLFAPGADNRRHRLFKVESRDGRLVLVPVS